MPNMPAFCESCGFVFPSGFVIENSSGVSFNGVRSQCPRCGGVGKVPDGIYNVLGEVVQLLAGPTSSARQLRDLQVVLKSARAKQQEPQEVREAILATAPELTGLASALPSTRVELYSFITIVLTLLALLVSTYAALKPGGPSQSEIDAMVQKAMDQAKPPAPPNTAKQATPPKRQKVGRNQTCHCGSGKKYKRCCLAAVA